MNCRFDRDFMSCLQRTQSIFLGSSIGDAVGMAYFNNEYREPKCYERTTPIGDCLLIHKIEDVLGKHKRCGRYSHKNGKVRSRIFDMPLYIVRSYLRSAIVEEDAVVNTNQLIID